jgi:hypothetical protein
VLSPDCNILTIPALLFSTTQDWFVVHDLDVERLLVYWRWLCEEPMALIAQKCFCASCFCVPLTVRQVPSWLRLSARLGKRGNCLTG